MPYPHHTQGSLKAAQQAHLIVISPTEQITTPKFNYGPKQILAGEQLDVFMKAIAEGEIWYDFFCTALATGLRQGESRGLRREDFSEGNGTLNVCRTVYRKDGGGLTAGDTKTYAGTQKIVLPASTASVLHERKKSLLTKWIFPSPLKTEQPADPGSAYRQPKVLLKRTELPSIRFHDFRHHISGEQYGYKDAVTIISHISSATALNVYTHAAGEMQKQAAAKSNRGIGKAELSAKSPQAAASRTMTGFNPKRGKNCCWQRIP